MKRYFRIISITLITFIAVVTAIDTLEIVIGYIPILNKIQSSVTDYDITDIVYSEKKASKKDTTIILVNLEHIERDTIGLLIKRISEGNPRVIGIDTYFRIPKDTRKDSILRHSIDGIENLVFLFVWQATSDSTHTFIFSDTTIVGSNRVFGYFGPQMFRIGNSFEELYSVRSDLPTAKKFLIYEWESDKYCFECEIVRKYDENLFKRLEQRQIEQFINYYADTTGFEVLSNKKIFAANFDVGRFNNKIILLGFLGYPRFGDPRNIEGKWVTPLNKEIVGNKLFDTYETVVEANIIKMILDENYIDSPSVENQWALSTLILLIIIIYFETRVTKDDGKKIRIICYVMVILLYASSIAALYLLNFKYDVRFLTFYLIALPEVYLIFKGKVIPKLAALNHKLSKRRTQNSTDPQDTPHQENQLG